MTIIDRGQYTVPSDINAADDVIERRLSGDTYSKGSPYKSLWEVVNAADDATNERRLSGNTYILKSPHNSLWD